MYVTCRTAAALYDLQSCRMNSLASTYRREERRALRVGEDGGRPVMWQEKRGDEFQAGCRHDSRTDSCLMAWQQESHSRKEGEKESLDAEAEEDQELGRDGQEGGSTTGVCTSDMPVHCRATALAQKGKKIIKVGEQGSRTMTEVQLPPPMPSAYFSWA